VIGARPITWKSCYFILLFEYGEICEFIDCELVVVAMSDDTATSPWWQISNIEGNLSGNNWKV